jgi:hypothetical protein
MRSPLVLTVRDSDSVEPRAESNSARFTYRAWASGRTGTRRLAVARTLIGVGVAASNGDGIGVEAVATPERNWEEGLEE